MKKSEAKKVCDFINNHYDMVDQESWFEFCEFLLNVVLREANVKGWTSEFVNRYPFFFEEVN